MEHIIATDFILKGKGMITIQQFIDGIPRTVELMKQTKQNPLYHGEGDVWAHTMMVMDCLHRLDEWDSLADHEKSILEFACVLHDVGKTVCTKVEDGELVSPNHSVKGEGIARRLLWDAGFNADGMFFREAVCALVRHHSKPVHFLDDVDRNEANAVMKLQRIASYSPARDFTLKLLHMLSLADWNGRVHSSKEDGLVSLDLFKEYACGNGCWLGSPEFHDAYSRHAFLHGTTSMPTQRVYDATKSQVIVMSGLPASGKSMWVEKNGNGCPVVCLDAIRADMKVKPSEDQSKVMQVAFDKARGYLRSHQTFIWDATCLSHDARRKIVGLAKDYGAFASVVYLECGDEERTRRNASREERKRVPDTVMERMKEHVEPPTFDEAHDAMWIPTSDHGFTEV